MADPFRSAQQLLNQYADNHRGPRTNAPQMFAKLTSAWICTY